MIKKQITISAPVFQEKGYAATCDRRGRIAFITGLGGLLLLGGCENPEAEQPVIKETPIIQQAPVPIASLQAPLKTIIQGGKNAFEGFEDVEIFKELTGEYSTLNDGIRAFIDWFELRDLANKDGVKAKAHIRTSDNGDTTWSYKLFNLPDDSVQAENYKVYFEKTAGGLKIARIGYRVKCYKSQTPDDWTTELCP